MSDSDTRVVLELTDDGFESVFRLQALKELLNDNRCTVTRVFCTVLDPETDEMNLRMISNGKQLDLESLVYLTPPRTFQLFSVWVVGRTSILDGNRFFVQRFFIIFRKIRFG